MKKFSKLVSVEDRLSSSTSFVPVSDERRVLVKSVSYRLKHVQRFVENELFYLPPEMKEKINSYKYRQSAEYVRIGNDSFCYVYFTFGVIPSI